MKKLPVILFVLLFIFSCKKNDRPLSDGSSENETAILKTNILKGLEEEAALVKQHPVDIRWQEVKANGRYYPFSVVDLMWTMPPTNLNQNGTPGTGYSSPTTWACNAFAAAVLMDQYNRLKFPSLYSSGGGWTNVFRKSPYWLYWKTGCSTDWWWVNKVMNEIKWNGCTNLTNVPTHPYSYCFSAWPQDYINSAASNKIGQWQYIDGTSSAAGLDQTHIKWCLGQNKAVLVRVYNGAGGGMSLNYNWNNPETAQTENLQAVWDEYTSGNNALSMHYIVIYAYDDTKKVFKAQNVTGPAFGNYSVDGGGRFHISYRCLQAKANAGAYIDY
jgi:hypothetical protein